MATGVDDAMSQELHYTSVPRGLLPGTRGFCTVACTPNMSGPLRERLESLSGYQQVFPPHDPKVGLNPVVFSHHRLNLGGRSYSVLSRVCFAGLDYTSRSNKYAHHVVLDPAERPAGGPAWLLSQPGFMEPIWLGEPRFIAAGRTPPQGDHPAGIAHAWQSLTGDAGWAGALAESFITDQQRPVVLIFHPETNLLPLLVEALALLPVPRRWDVEFSTYFTQLPHGLTCAWRGVLAGTEPARQSLPTPNVLILELDGSMREAPDGPLVQLARRGYRPEDIGKAIEEVRRRQGSQQASRAGGGRAVDQSHSAGARAQDQLSSQTPAYEVIPKLGSVTRHPPLPLAVSAPRSRRGDARRSRYLATIVTSLFVLITVSLVFAVYGTRLRSILGPSKAHSLIEESRTVLAAAKSESKKSEPKSVGKKEAPSNPSPDGVVQTHKVIPTPPGAAVPPVEPKAPLPKVSPERKEEKLVAKLPNKSNVAKVLWRELEEPVSENFGRVTSPPSPGLDLEVKNDRILSISLLTSSPSLKAEYIASKSLKIRCTDRPGAEELAEFPFSVDLRMSFHWSKAAQSSSWRTIRSSLRDCAIKIEFLDAPDHLVVLRKRVEDHLTPLELISKPLTWDTEGVFSESKNLVFIDRVFVDGIPAATANHNKGTYLRKTQDLAEWTLFGEESNKKLVSIRLDRKDGQVHVHPEYDQKYLNPQKVDHDLTRIARDIKEIGREIQRVEFELSHGNMNEER